MILTDYDIIGYTLLGKDGLKINPFNEDLVKPCSYDVTLADDFIIFNKLDQSDGWKKKIDPTKNNSYLCNRISSKWQSCEINPKEFMLARTIEKISLPENMMCRLEGKSSLARIGLAAHITAGHIDPGFKGTITLELVNHSEYIIDLAPLIGKPIAQLVFYTLNRRVLRPYDSPSHKSKYQNQTGTTPSKYHLNFCDKEEQDGEV